MKKMQESIHKNLEELNNKHAETNNTIIKTKNTLKGINSRISETEEQINEVEDKIVEITTEEQNKVKEWKELRIVSENSGTIANKQTFELQEFRRRREKERVWENFWSDYSQKYPKYGKGNSQSSPRSIENPIQDKPKEENCQDTY